MIVVDAFKNKQKKPISFSGNPVLHSFTLSRYSQVLVQLSALQLLKALQEQAGPSKFMDDVFSSKITLDTDLSQLPVTSIRLDWEMLLIEPEGLAIM